MTALMLPTPDGPIVGMTGTRKGLTDAQRKALSITLRVLFGKGMKTLSQGCCVGSDAQAARMAKQSGYLLVGRPGHLAALVDEEAAALCDVFHPPEDTLVRNGKIVAEAAVLVACPEAEEVVRSGTWSTIRKGRAAKRPIVIVWPDGRVTTEGDWK